jgi:gliding motility-associated-like protein
VPLRKIVTPNGDGANDFASFSGLVPPYTLKIFNVKGREIASLEDISSPIWDATDEDGDIVESGIYIYQVEKDGSMVTGIIVVAK